MLTNGPFGRDQGRFDSTGVEVQQKSPETLIGELAYLQHVPINKDTNIYSKNIRSFTTILLNSLISIIFLPVAVKQSPEIVAGKLQHHLVSVNKLSVHNKFHV